MATEETQVTLSNPLNDHLTQRILDVIGTSCTNVVEYSNDPNDPWEVWDSWSQFPNETPSLLVQGEDGWGSVTGAGMFGDHLILTVNFGERGNYEFSPTTEGDYNTAKDNLWINRLRGGAIAILTPLP